MLMPAYAKKLWKTICDHFNRQYTVLLIRATNDHKPASIGELVTKSKKEHFFIKDVFAGNITQKDMEEVAKLLDLYVRIMTESAAAMVEDIVALAVKLKEDYNDNVLVMLGYQKTIMKVRPEFGDKEKKLLMEKLKQSSALAAKGKRDLALEFYKASMKELRVHKFINMLKHNHFEKKRQRLQVINQQDKSTFLSVNITEQKVSRSH